MGRQNIEKFSWTYYLLKVYGRMMHYLYYGRLRVRGKVNIPDNEPMIFAPNHQNALMDALAVLFTYPRQMVFLARADIFRSSFFSAILTFLKIMPVFRIRDGYSALQQNTEIFTKTIDILKAKRPLVILPEGNHEGTRRLRPFKKGIARIAFQAEEACDFKLGLNIVPVGLDYSRYEKSGAELLVQYGEPIRVSDYFDSYHENPARGVNELIAELRKRIGELMIDIRSEEHYEMIDILRRCYAYTILKDRHFRVTPWNRHAAEIETIRLLEEYIEKNPESELLQKLTETAREYRTLLGYNKLQFRNPEEGRWPWWKIIGQGLLFILCFPLFLAGFINNLLPVLLPKSIVVRIKDVQFRSTFKFGMSILTFPIFYAIQIILFHALAPWPGIWTLLYAISLPITGWIAVRYRLLFRRFLARLRFRFLRYTFPSQYRNIVRLRAEIDGMMREVVV